MKGKNRIIALVLSCAFSLSGAALLAGNASPQDAQAPAAQDASLDQQIQMMRKDIRSQRKQVIAANMNLTDAEAVKFWPIYDKYVSDLVETNHAKYELIKEYASSDTISDEQADSMAQRWLTVDENVVKLRVKYLPTFRAALSAKQTARFFQLDRRVQMMIDLQLASALPLLGP